MPKVKEEKLSLPQAPKFIARFNFVRDSLLRTNLGICLQYVTFLLGLYEDESLPGNIRYSIAKDIIVNTATIIEAIEHYWIEELVTTGQISLDRILPPKKEYKKRKFLVTDEDGDDIWTCWEKVTSVNLKGEVNFIDLNKALKRAGYIKDPQYKRLEKIRSWRNKIHIKGLASEEDDLFTDADIEEAFSIAKDIIEKVENNLTQLL